MRKKEHENEEIRTFIKKSVLSKTFFSIRLLILVSLALCLALIYVGIKVEEERLEYEISENKNKEEALLKENLVLRREFAKLKSLERIEKTAKEIGLKFPTQGDINCSADINSDLIGKRQNSRCPKH
jgi:cell division protein FtsL